MIFTERLTLRPFRLLDYDDFREYCVQPEVGGCAGWRPHETESETMQILRNFTQSEDILGIVENASGRLIGSIGIHVTDARVGNCRSLGYVLNRNFWGRGYMTEAARAAIDYAFTTMELDFMVVARYDYNQRSHRVIEKCGFVCEGMIHNEKARYDGVPLNVYHYYLSRERWEELRNVK
jgi:RimJ/RimL family protein N-acetyltransferase